MLVAVFAGVSNADIVVPENARKDLQLCIYKDFAIVKDQRRINIPEGTNRIRFEGVATGIKPESVNLEWPSADGLELLAQSYEFDLVSPAKLMEKYIGREIEIVPRKDQWPDTAVKSAELISINGEEPVFRIGTKITFGDIGQMLFPYIPDNLYTKPTLLWDIVAQKRQETGLVATYLTEGISWSVGYLLQVDQKEENGVLGGWITFENKSGLDYNNAQVTFVNGMIPRIWGGASASNKKQHCTRPETGDFYFFSMNQNVSILDNHAKQVKWIPRVPVRLKQGFFGNVGDGNSFEPVPVYTMVEVENATTNSLGIPLPEGVIRIFKKDAQENDRFIGENVIGDTKVGHSFFATSGLADGVVITSKKESGSSRSSSDENLVIIEIKNMKDKSIACKLHGSTDGRRVIRSSEKYRLLSGTTLEWNLLIKSQETYKLSYRLANE